MSEKDKIFYDYPSITYIIIVNKVKRKGTGAI
jgi:hypothetical protein